MLNIRLLVVMFRIGLLSSFESNRVNLLMVFDHFCLLSGSGASSPPTCPSSPTPPSTTGKLVFVFVQLYVVPSVCLFVFLSLYFCLSLFLESYHTDRVSHRHTHTPVTRTCWVPMASLSNIIQTTKNKKASLSLTLNFCPQ